MAQVIPERLLSPNHADGTDNAVRVHEHPGIRDWMPKGAFSQLDSEFLQSDTEFNMGSIGSAVLPSTSNRRGSGLGKTFVSMKGLAAKTGACTCAAAGHGVRVGLSKRFPACGTEEISSGRVMVSAPSQNSLTCMSQTVRLA